MSLPFPLAQPGLEATGNSSLTHSSLLIVCPRLFIGCGCGDFVDEPSNPWSVDGRSETINAPTPHRFWDAVQQTVPCEPHSKVSSTGAGALYSHHSAGRWGCGFAQSVCSCVWSCQSRADATCWMCDGDCSLAWPLKHALLYLWRQAVLSPLTAPTFECFFSLTLVSFGAQLVKNLPAMQETWVWFLGWRKISWRGKWPPIPVSLPGESHGQRSLAGYNPWGHKSRTWPSDWNQTIGWSALIQPYLPSGLIMGPWLWFES